MDVTDLSDDSSHGEVVRLEAYIEELAGKLESCRKVSLAARIVVAGGVAIFLAGLVGFMAFDVTTVLASIAAVIGGLVLLGSNSSTADETSGEMAKAQAKRAALIDSIRLRVVGSSTVH